MLHKLQQVRAQLQKDFQQNRSYSEGSNSGYDTARIFQIFNPLRLKDGYRLRLLNFAWVRYSGPYIFAVPSELIDAPIPKPTEGPHHIPGALPHFMQAIEGDDTPWSYLLASLLSRDADELGAYQTGARFKDQDLLGECPQTGGQEGPVEAYDEREYWKDRKGCLAVLTRWLLRNHLPVQYEAEDSWSWDQPQPQNWQPQVHLDQTTAVVTFYTYKLYYGEAITRYTDTYQRGSYHAQVKEEHIASGPNVIVT